MTEGTHEGLVDPETWRESNENLQKVKTRKAHRPRSGAYYLRPLLVCGHCGRPMEARMEQGGNPGNRRRYPIYYCSVWDEAKQYRTVRHRIRHSEVEAFILKNLEALHVEVGQATEVQALAELYDRYTQDEADAKEFFRKGVQDYLAEVRHFQEWAGCLDPHLADIISAVARHPDWNFAEKGADPGYDDLKALLHQIDARKVALATERLAELEAEHRGAVRYAMRHDLDERTQRVAQDEVNRLATRMKGLEAETTPFLDRYQERLAQLQEFRHRLLALLNTLKTADVDARAVKLAEVLKSVTLYFLPRKRWQQTKLDEARTELAFNHTFVENAGTY